MSYTQFDYSGLSVAQEKDTVVVSFILTNTGERAGDEVVQLYVKEESQRPKAPLKSLKGFQRVFLEAGERKSIRFSVPLEELKHWNSTENKFVLEEAFYEIQLGASSEDIRLKQGVNIH